MTTHDITLPELAEGRIDEIETALFDRIAQDRRDALADSERARARAVRRGRVWMGTAGAAAFIAIAAIIAPQLAFGTAATTTADEAFEAGSAPAMSPLLEGATVARDGAASGAESADSSAVAGSELMATDREIIATASATVRVDDLASGARQIGDAATAAGGYVESMSIDRTALDASTDVTPEIYPAYSGTWITVRVPADQLEDTIAGLAEVGEVTASQIDRQDVTTETVDVRARVTALEASVARLTELMGESTSTADLIAAESALAERQSELDALRQQLTWLENQVDMSTLTVSLTVSSPPVEADPAGFGDGLAAGWNGLVASLNGLVVAIGFLLPWVALLAVAGLAVWGVRHAIRARRARRAEDQPAQE